MYYIDEHNHHSTQNSVGEVDLPEHDHSEYRPMQTNAMRNVEDTQEFCVDFDDVYELDDENALEDCFGYGDQM